MPRGSVSGDDERRWACSIGKLEPDTKRRGDGERLRALRPASLIVQITEPPRITVHATSSSSDATIVYMFEPRSRNQITDLMTILTLSLRQDI